MHGDHDTVGITRLSWVHAAHKLRACVIAHNAMRLTVSVDAKIYVYALVLLYVEKLCCVDAIAALKMAHAPPEQRPSKVFECAHAHQTCICISRRRVRVAFAVISVQARAHRGSNFIHRQSNTSSSTRIATSTTRHIIHRCQCIAVCSTVQQRTQAGMHLHVQHEQPTM